MAQLNSIIGSVLRDIVRAQHLANLYAVSLSPMYAGDGVLSKFPMPGVALGDLELDFSYMISDGDGAPSQYEINYSELRSVIADIASRYAHEVVDTVCDTVRKLFPVDTVTGNNPLAKFDSGVAYRKRIEDFLSHNFVSALRPKFLSLVDESTGSLRRDMVRSVIYSSACDNLVDHSDLADLFASQDNSRAKVLEALDKVLDSVSSSILDGVCIRHKAVVPSMDVMVDGKSLADAPQGCVHQIRIKVNPRDINLYDAE